MTLEDHLGDVVRKARMMLGKGLEEVGRAAGLAGAELEALEGSGQGSGRLDYAALGRALGLRPEALAGIASGWLPKVPDLSRWRELRRVSTSEGMEVHSYLIWDEATREAAVFDTGFEAGPILALVEEHGLELNHLFITHGHADHVAAVEPLRRRLPRLRVHRSAADAPVEHRNRASDFIAVGGLRITHRPTPGHAADGVTYLVGNWPEDAPVVAVVGDAIFAGSMGGAPGLGELARRKVRAEILSLPPETLICPGHGPLTTVGEEREHNPFF